MTRKVIIKIMTEREDGTPLPEDFEKRDDIFTVHGGQMLHELLYIKKNT